LEKEARKEREKEIMIEETADTKDNQPKPD